MGRFCRIVLLTALSIGIALGTGSSAYALGYDEQETLFEVATEIVGTINDVDEDELLKGYIDSQCLNMGIAEDGRPSNRDKLTDFEKAVYDQLVAMVQEVATGNRESTSLAFDVGAYFDKDEWSDIDLGVTLATPNNLASAFNSKLAAIYRPEFVYKAARADYPYEFFWSDIVFIYTNTPDYSYKGNIFSATITPKDIHLIVCPSWDYRKNGDDRTADSGKTRVASQVIWNANRIVADAANLSDYDKLYTYMTTICELNSYNFDAANGVYGYYGDPWQLIYVFDGNPYTNVVCEGYSKAFKYLCDMTTFDNPDIYAYTVTGSLDSVEHMWNIVHMDDGKNYMMDVTNCDDDNKIDNNLFLATPYLGSCKTFYIFKTHRGISFGYYYYDEDTFGMYSEDELTISGTAYKKPASRPAQTGNSTGNTSGSSGGSITGNNTGSTSQTITDGIHPTNMGWYLYENEKVAYGYNGIYCDPAYGWWLVLDGKVAFEYSDLYCDSRYGWWKIANGAVDFGYTGLYESVKYGWWLIGGGQVAFYYNDLWGDSNYGWWKVIGGQVDFGYTGLYNSPTCGWWLIGGGNVAFYYNGIWNDSVYGPWNVQNGMVCF